MAALSHQCELSSIPGFKFQPIDDFTVDEEYCNYYPCWDGKVLFISLSTPNNEKFNENFPLTWLCSVDYKNIKQKYKDAILKHNNSLENNGYPDAGFDVFVPEQPNEKNVN